MKIATNPSIDRIVERTKTSATAITTHLNHEDGFRTE